MAYPKKASLDLIRAKCVHYRAKMLEMIHRAASGHPGGSLSLTEVVSLLFNNHLVHFPEKPDNPERDRFVLSKGHAVPVLYAALADCGYFPAEELMTLRQLGSRLQGHPDRAQYSVMEASTGSLGQGFSVAQGMALAMKLDGRTQGRVWCIIGDGESQEGQIWETAMSAPKFQLDNLITILDYNGGQIDGPVKDVMDLEPVADKWRAFNWDVHVVDGHDLVALDSLFTKVRDAANQGRKKPQFIIANTVKGKGVSFMEGQIKWHGVAPTKDELSKAIDEVTRNGISPKAFGPGGTL